VIENQEDRRNKDNLRRALEIYSIAWRRFIIEKLEAAPGVAVKDAIADSLKGDNRTRFLTDIRKKKTPADLIDIGEFPEIVGTHWDAVFSRHFVADPDILRLLRRIRTFRNLLSHNQIRNLSTVGTLDHLASIERALTAINDTDTRNGVLSLRNELTREAAHREASEDEAADSTMDLTPEVEADEVEEADNIYADGLDSDEEVAIEPLEDGIHLCKVILVSAGDSMTGNPRYRFDFRHRPTRTLLWKTYSLLPQSRPYLAIMLDEFDINPAGIEDAFDNQTIRGEIERRIRDALQGKEVYLDIEWREGEFGARYEVLDMINPAHGTPVVRPKQQTQSPAKRTNPSRSVSINDDDLPF